jgi:hypothetical protein
VREWGGEVGSLQKLDLWHCNFGDEVVDFGSCDTLTHLRIEDCRSKLITTPGDSLGCTRLLWGILPKCKTLKSFYSCVNDDVGFSLDDRDLCLLARFCPQLTNLGIHSPMNDFSEAALMGVAMKCTELEDLDLYSQRTYTDRTIQAIAANLVSLRTLTVWNLQLHNPHTLRCLAIGCPELWYLYIHSGKNVTEAELLYLVEHAKNLELLTIGKWGQLDLRERWEQLQPYGPEDLLQLGIDGPEALLASQRDRLQVLSAAIKQPDAMDTVDRLRAASSHPDFEIELDDVEDE